MSFCEKDKMKATNKSSDGTNISCKYNTPIDITTNDFIRRMKQAIQVREVESRVDQRKKSGREATARRCSLRSELRRLGVRWSNEAGCRLPLVGPAEGGWRDIADLNGKPPLYGKSPGGEAARTSDIYLPSDIYARDSDTDRIPHVSADIGKNQSTRGRRHNKRVQCCNHGDYSETGSANGGVYYAELVKVVGMKKSSRTSSAARDECTSLTPRVGRERDPSEHQDTTPTTVTTPRRPFTRRSTSRTRPPARPDFPSSKMDVCMDEEEPSRAPLMRMNHDLRHRLHDEAAAYRRRLDTYREAQQHQAALVSRLQAKVMQYKQRCAELEGLADADVPPASTTRSRSGPASAGPAGAVIALPPPSAAMEQAQQHLRETRNERVQDLDTALRRLDEEKRNCERLVRQNATLREQLEESHRNNEVLSADLQKLTTDWECLREEMAIKEDEWKEEEVAFNEYYNTEHSRLLGLWRYAVAVKRSFNDMQAATERDLSSLRGDISRAGRDMQAACAAVSEVNAGALTSAQTVRPDPQQAAEQRAKFIALTAQHEAALADVAQKDTRIQQLLRELQALEERCAESEHAAGQAGRARDEVELLQGALRDIAHAVLQDAEAPGQPAHMHLSQNVPVPQRSPKRGGSGGSTRPAFAEGTISAVQAALHKYQLLIHELQIKLQASRDALNVLKKQFEAGESSRAALATKVTELTAQLDACNAQKTNLTQERDLLLKNADAARIDKASLERSKNEMTAMIENLNSDYEKQQKNNIKMQKLYDSLEDEKRFIQNELDRVSQEANNGELALRREEERSGRLKEELLTIREELSNVYLSRDMLEQQRLETDSLIAHIEKVKGDLEVELERTILEKNDLKEALEKTENSASGLDQEKSKLNDQIKTLKEECNNLQTHCSDQQNDLKSLRKELLAAEQSRLEVESEKLSLYEKNKFLSIEKEKLDQELAQSVRDRGELNNQLVITTRKKESLGEELMRVQQRLEQATETNSRVNRNLEDLVKENEEKLVTIESNEKDLQRLSEQLAALRSEKESLEAALFDTNTNLEECDLKRSQLEKDLQETLVKQENLKGHVTRLTRDLENSERRSQEMKMNLLKQSGDQQAEFQQTISNLKKNNENNCKKLTEEKEQIRVAFEKRMQTSLQSLSNEKNAEIDQLQCRIGSLQNHIESLSQQHEEELLRAENDKQQALLIAHHDQQALLEKLECLKRELDSERQTLERAIREAAAKAEHDRNAANQLRDEISKLKTRMEENRNKASEEYIRLEGNLNEIKQERDMVQRNAEELKLQLSLCEDKSEALSNQLQDTVRKLKEAENTTDSVRKDLTDTRRQLAESNVERDKYGSSNRELRDAIKRNEGERREQSRSIEEAMQKISSLEETRNHLELEKVRLQTTIREAERLQLQTAQQLTQAQNELVKAAGDNSQKQAEEKELQARLHNECEERERVQHELHQLKKQMSELDNNLEATRQELCRARARLGHEEGRWHCREQELLSRLEESRGREKRLDDQKHNLEVCLADATQQIQELKARLGGAEGRIRALDGQLSQSETAKKEVEQKLSSVGCTLRRIAGIQLDGSVNLPYRLLSPTRRWSPARGAHESRQTAASGAPANEIVDVDPEFVRKGVRGLMQQVAQIERERDDYKSQISQARNQLQEASEVQNKTDEKMKKVLQNLRSLQNEKGSIEAQLGQKTVTLNTQNEALQEKTEELNAMREKVTSLELSISSGTEEKNLCEERLEKCRSALARLEGERRALQEELARCEQRSSKLELQKVAHEGDVQRLQMMVQEREAIIQKLQERVDVQACTVSALEERCGSLKVTIEQLNISLDRAANAEADLRSELGSLQVAQHANVATSHAVGDKLKHLQKALQTAENEKRVFAERLDSAQQNCAELRRTVQIQNDQLQRLQTDLANNEVQKGALESQLRLASWGDSQPHGRDDELQRQVLANQKERSELRGKVDSLTDKVRQLESEKRSLERNGPHQDSSQFDTLSRKQAESKCPKEISSARDHGPSNEHSFLDQENRELRLKVRRLETQLAEKEAELSRMRSRLYEDPRGFADGSKSDRHRALQSQAERLLESREQSHKQQILRLENQITMLKEQLAQEAKRRQMYVLRSTKAGREMQQLRQTLGDSLRHVSQEPIDAMLLEHEARRLDSAVSLSLPSTDPMTDYNITPKDP